MEITALGFMMMASNITGFGGASFTPFVAPEVIEVKETLPYENKKTQIDRTMTVEEYVRNYFSDIPILIEVAKCESHFRQHDKNGNVLQGEENSQDKGVMQINEYYHSLDSDRLGYDVMTIEGNTAYARYLFEKSGLKPWKSSRRCWGKTLAYSDYQSLAMK